MVNSDLCHCPTGTPSGPAESCRTPCSGLWGSVKSGEKTVGDSIRPGSSVDSGLLPACGVTTEHPTSLHLSFPGAKARPTAVLLHKVVVSSECDQTFKALSVMQVHWCLIHMINYLKG